MARYRDRGRKALYEVMSQTRQKTGNSDTIERLHPQKIAQDKPVSEQNTVVNEPKTTIPWWKKPRIVQFNSGRIELSVPYQIAVVVAMGLVLVLLLTFRLGQYSAPTPPKQATPQRIPGNASTNPAARTGTNTNTGSSGGTTPTRTTVTPAGGSSASAADSAGKNVLVLARYRAKADLEAARLYFEKNGVSTEIVQKNDNMYYLRTTARFVEDPGNPGTAGYELKMKIKDLGKKYKAPSGYESFAPNYFGDAYGEKVN